MIGQIISHYKILEKLGEGGMGAVYKALDIKLERVVALKFLSTDATTNEEDQARFLLEARAVAKLSHPAICSIHSIGEYEDQQFIDMEFIEGATLREKLPEMEGDLLRSVIIAIRIAEALSTAHAKGIVHRDIKPENIMINEEAQVKVMDFGLAKLKNAENLTEPGRTVGTPAYMSPEQVQEGVFDHRSDIFSFGVVFYEMIAGQNPFRKEHHAATLYSIVNEVPPSLSEILLNAPPRLDRLMDRMLQKYPEQRLSSMNEVLSELGQVLEELTEHTTHTKKESSALQPAESSASNKASKGPSFGSGPTNITIRFPPLRSRAGLSVMTAGLVFILLAGYWLLSYFSTPNPLLYNSIGVLPLENLSPEPDDAFFADGMHEEIISSLAGIGALKVIARSSVLGYSPENRNLARIGQELGVSTLMEGTVRRAGERIRVSVQLIDTGNRTTIWSGTYEDHVHDVFGIQSRIAREVAGALQTTLTARERQRLEERPTDNPQAYHFYMQGRDYLSRSNFQAENSLAAEQLFRRSLQEDPRFAHAWAMLALVYSDLYWFHGYAPGRLEQMQAAVDRAELLAPDLAETKLAIGVYHYWSDPDYERTLSYFESTLQQFPNHPVLHLFTGLTHRRMGDPVQEESHLKRAIELDPRNSNYYQELSFFYYLIRDYNKAVAVSDRLLEMSPDAPSFSRALRALYMMERDGTFDGYEAWQEEIYPSDPVEIAPFYWGYFYYYFNRDWEGALRSFTNIESEIAWQTEIFYTLRDYLIAVVYDQKGERTTALGYYKQARLHLEDLREEHPEDPRYRVALGKIYARMGETEKAIEEGKIASELIPLNKNAFEGGWFERELAHIYTLTSRYEEAIDKLELLLSIPSFVHRNQLRINPDWDPLREHPRFQALIAERDVSISGGI